TIGQLGQTIRGGEHLKYTCSLTQQREQSIKVVGEQPDFVSASNTQAQVKISSAPHFFNSPSQIVNGTNHGQVQQQQQQRKDHRQYEERSESAQCERFLTLSKNACAAFYGKPRYWLPKWVAQPSGR